MTTTLKTILKEISALHTEVVTLQETVETRFDSVSLSMGVLDAKLDAVRSDIRELQHFTSAGFERLIDTRGSQAEIMARLVAIEEHLGIDPRKKVSR
jgi:hypothetical protein